MNASTNIQRTSWSRSSANSLLVTFVAALFAASLLLLLIAVGRTDAQAQEDTAQLSQTAAQSGQVWAWGSNEGGQLGDGTNLTYQSTPVQVGNLSGVTAMGGGVEHSLALKEDGTVWTWGSNLYGQLGDGTNTDHKTPALVSNLSGVTAVSAGPNHSLALKEDGTVWAWGYNRQGELGDGTNTDSNTPVQVSNLSGATAIDGGANHSVALRNDGTVWAWGYNHQGQLGDGTNTSQNGPVQVSDLSGVTAVSAGAYHSLALKNDGTVWTWGLNSLGQLGDGTTTNQNTPVQVSNLSGVTAVAAGGFHNLALKSDGSIWVWGYNSSGQLGDGTNTDSNTPIQVSNLSGITAVAAGNYHSLALRNDGTVLAWGYNPYGQLGDGTFTDSNTPVQVSNLSGVTAVAASTHFHSLALTPSDTRETVTQEVTAGQTPTTVTTDAEEDGATPSDPVETNLTIPAGVGGAVSIAETSTTQQAPAGFSFLDHQVEITAPVATPNNPLTLELRIDSSKVSSGQTENDIEIFRNGVRVGDCTGASATASPDPCVSGRQRLTDGDVLITVLTSQASFWNFAIPEEGQPLYNFKGFFQPVDNPPTINTVSSGQTGKAIPVTFSLGGDMGLQIFSSGSPSSQKVNCIKRAPSDAIETTLNARSSSLSYNTSTGKYTYLWKTDKAWVGSCRQLNVKLNDLTEHTALFKFR